MNRGAELLGAPESRAEKFHASKEYATSEKLTSKLQETIKCVNETPQSPTALSALRASSFSPWRPAEGIEGPQVTVEPGPLRALLCHWPALAHL